MQESHPPKIAGIPTMPKKEEDLEPIGLVEDEQSDAPVQMENGKKIRALGVAEARHAQDRFQRTPANTGRGACRVRSFHGKLSDQGLGFIDDAINEWLDKHPEIEIKFVTSTIGTFEGKIREPALILNLWY